MFLQFWNRSKKFVNFSSGKGSSFSFFCKIFVFTSNFKAEYFVQPSNVIHLIWTVPHGVCRFMTFNDKRVPHGKLCLWPSVTKEFQNAEFTENSDARYIIVWCCLILNALQLPYVGVRRKSRICVYVKAKFVAVKNAISGNWTLNKWFINSPDF